MRAFLIIIALVLVPLSAAESGEGPGWIAAWVRATGNVDVRLEAVLNGDAVASLNVYDDSFQFRGSPSNIVTAADAGAGVGVGPQSVTISSPGTPLTYQSRYIADVNGDLLFIGIVAGAAERWSLVVDDGELLQTSQGTEVWLSSRQGGSQGVSVHANGVVARASGALSREHLLHVENILLGRVAWGDSKLDAEDVYLSTPSGETLCPCYMRGLSGGPVLGPGDYSVRVEGVRGAVLDNGILYYAADVSPPLPPP